MKKRTVKKLRLKKSVKMVILTILLIVLYFISGTLGTINTTLACITWLLMGCDFLGMLILEEI